MMPSAPAHARCRRRATAALMVVIAALIPFDASPIGATNNPLDAPKYGVAFPTPSSGYAVGGDTRIFGRSDPVHTADGGGSWAPQSAPNGTDFLFSVAFVTTTTQGWAVGYSFGLGGPGDGAIISTRDGTSWGNDTAPTGVGPLRSVATGDANHAWAVGQSSSPDHHPVIVASPQPSSSGVLFVGRWTEQAVPGDIQFLSGVAATDALHAWAVGGSCSTGAVIIATTDGGATWNRQAVPPGLNSLNAVTFANASVGWAVGGNTTGVNVPGCLSAGTSPPGILATTDGGATWTRQVLPPGIDAINGVSFSGNSMGYAVGANGARGAIMGTSDGGASWRLEPVPCGTHALMAVSSPDGNHAWAVGNGGPGDLGVVLATSNRGATWAPQIPASLGSGGCGYWLVASDGGLFGYGDVRLTDSAGGSPLNKPVVGMAATPGSKGYWLVASDGGIFNYGDAAFFGSTGAIHLNKPIVGMAATPTGKGYTLVASDGGIFTYGDAGFFGSTGAIHLNKPIVGMTATPTGKGYTLVASDGGIFTYGDAAFFGSTGAIHLNQDIVGMAATPTANGYWLVASDGGIFNYGDAAFRGSGGGLKLAKPIVGIAATPGGTGYDLVASDGGILTYGGATFFGSAGALHLNKPVVGMAISSPTD